jgi:hypothetical protein
MHRSWALKSIVLGAALWGAAAALHAASVSVDPFSLLSHGAYDEDSGLFAVDSRLDFGLALSGGDKFAGLLRLEYRSGTVENDLYQNGLTLDAGTATTSDIVAKLNAASGLALRTAAVSAREIAGLPLEATYFVGYLDSICSGDDFVRLFGAAPFATALRGPLYYPDGVGGDASLSYDGLDAVYGTGARLSLAGEHSAAFLYLFQDSDLGQGNWSGDLRGLLDGEKIKLELFAGASLAPACDYGLYRGGLLFDYRPGSLGEFFAQVGIPRWDPSEAFSINNFFFLFEPRVVLGPTNLAITVFYHPSYYREKATGEKGALDLCVNWKLGNLAATGSQGGLSTLLEFRPLEDSPLSVDIAPYFSVISWGLEWSMKLDLVVFPYPAEWYGMFSPFIGVKTSF